MAAENGVQSANNESSVAGYTAPPADLVQRVADAVYQLFLRDIRLERERRGDCGLPAHQRDRLSNFGG
jgi:hypothetical protein